MRLINAHNFSLEEFFNDDTPKYAILSHTWAAEEVSFKDMQNLNDQVKAKPGFEKILLTCEQALVDNLDWAWVDTCCIDKTSSAELSEAINSMYAWYHQSAICYAYLTDVPFTSPDNTSWRLDFRKSRWFTRGWTLQELIAPRKVVFYGQNWVEVGMSLHATQISGRPTTDLDIAPITMLVASITGIPAGVLIGKKSLASCSVAQRLSWASARSCSRKEDDAYCLLGIFDVNMPLLYGEGNKAFVRLQEEIMKTTDDHSILAWTADKPHRIRDLDPVLAPSPSYFAKSSHIVSTGEEKGTLSVMTKHGLQMGVFYRRSGLSGYHREEPQSFAIVTLNCRDTRAKMRFTRLGMILVRASCASEDRYFRLSTSSHVYLIDSVIFDDSSSLRTIFIRQRLVNTEDTFSIMLGSPMITLQFSNLPLEPWTDVPAGLDKDEDISNIRSIQDLASCLGESLLIPSRLVDPEPNPLAIAWLSSDCWAISQLRLHAESFVEDINDTNRIMNLGPESVFVISPRRLRSGLQSGIVRIQPFYMALCLCSETDEGTMFLFRPRRWDGLGRVAKYLATLQPNSSDDEDEDDSFARDNGTLSSFRLVDLRQGAVKPVRLVSTLPIDGENELVFVLSYNKRLTTATLTADPTEIFEIKGGIRNFRGSVPLSESEDMHHEPTPPSYEEIG